MKTNSVLGDLVRLKNPKWYNVPAARLTTDAAPYELGHAHGTHFKQLVTFMLREHALRQNHDRDLDLLEPLLVERLDWLKKTFPNEASEIEGIAVGAGVSPLLVLFYSYYNGLGFPVNIPNVNIPQCTSFCVPGRLTNSGTILGGNCDDSAHYFFLEYTGSHYYKHFQGIYTGCVGGFGGMNEHGLFIGGTGGSIVHADDRLGPKHFTPSLMTYNLVLRYCRNVDEALKLLAREDVMGHSNHLIADSSGRAVIMEKALAATLDTLEITEPLALGNFFHLDAKNHPDALAKMFKRNPAAQSRYLAMCRSLEEMPRPLTVDHAKKIMAGHHKGRPEVKLYASVCNYNTQISYVALPQDRTLYISGKYPHDHNWLEYHF